MPWFYITTLRDSLKKLAPLCHPIKKKLKQIVTHLDKFSRPSRQFHAFTLNFNGCLHVFMIILCDWPELRWGKRILEKRVRESPFSFLFFNIEGSTENYEFPPPFPPSRIWSIPAEWLLILFYVIAPLSQLITIQNYFSIFLWKRENIKKICNQTNKQKKSPPA